jgi:hypothetical protein
MAVLILKKESHESRNFLKVIIVSFHFDIIFYSQYVSENKKFFMTFLYKLELKTQGRLS